MKLVTYDPGSGARAGVLLGDRILDVGALLGSPERPAVTLPDVRALLELGDASLDLLRERVRVNAPAAPKVPLAEARLRSPVLQPPTVRDFMRDLQFDEMECRLGPAKGKDAATSLGPCLVTTDELLPFMHNGRLHVRCTLKVNGEQWMDANAGDMQFSWGDFVERASRDSRIAPGDVLGSGTVSGGAVGEAIGRGGAIPPTGGSGRNGGGGHRYAAQSLRSESST